MTFNRLNGYWEETGTYDIMYDIAYDLYVKYCIEKNMKSYEISEQSFFVDCINDDEKLLDSYRKKTEIILRKEKLKKLNENK